MDEKTAKKPSKLERVIKYVTVASLIGVGVNEIKRSHCISALYKEAVTAPFISEDYKSSLIARAENLEAEYDKYLDTSHIPFISLFLDRYSFKPVRR